MTTGAGGAPPPSGPRRSGPPAGGTRSERRRAAKTGFSTQRILIALVVVVVVLGGVLVAVLAGGREDGPASDEASTTSTTDPDSTVPSEATYDLTIAGGSGQCTPFSETTTATLSGGTLTIQTRVPLTASVNPDGTWAIDASIEGSASHIEGRLDGSTITGQATETSGSVTCTYEINGTRA